MYATYFQFSSQVSNAITTGIDNIIKVPRATFFLPA